MQPLHPPCGLCTGPVASAATASAPVLRPLQVLTAELEDLRLTQTLLRQRMRSLEQQAARAQGCNPMCQGLQLWMSEAQP